MFSCVGKFVLILHKFPRAWLPVGQSRPSSPLLCVQPAVPDGVAVVKAHQFS